MEILWSGMSPQDVFDALLSAPKRVMSRWVREDDVRHGHAYERWTRQAIGGRADPDRAEWYADGRGYLDRIVGTFPTRDSFDTWLRSHGWLLA
jgi:hypothetical protein